MGTLPSTVERAENSDLATVGGDSGVGAGALVQREPDDPVDQLLRRLDDRDDSDVARAIGAGILAGRATKRLEPENEWNASADMVSSFLATYYGKPMVEGYVRERTDVHLDVDQEVYAEVGAILGDLIYTEFLQN